MHWPDRIQPRKDWYREPTCLLDLMPTFLELSDSRWPQTFHGNAIPALEGLSLTLAFDGKRLQRTTPIFSEHESNAFIMDGKWKLVGQGVAPATGVDTSKWELYDLESDRTELNNLMDSHSETAHTLAAKWQAWAQRVAVYPKPQKKRGRKKAK